METEEMVKPLDLPHTVVCRWTYYFSRIKKINKYEYKNGAINTTHAATNIGGCHYQITNSKEVAIHFKH